MTITNPPHSPCCPPHLYQRRSLPPLDGHHPRQSTVQKAATSQCHLCRTQPQHRYLASSCPPLGSCFVTVDLRQTHLHPAFKRLTESSPLRHQPPIHHHDATTEDAKAATGFISICTLVFQELRREAITSKDKGGMVIIIDVVINEEKDEDDMTKTKLFFDTLMMVLLTGKERDKKEWEKLFFNAGFTRYNIVASGRWNEIRY
ncbi:hypothetical protein FH972_012881 [Carpinus fangiana]|uniref:O-methyltransferase C-terminal domain-containing protein n=1 Tax=Carpinus fangiana TaxID=176857 RepID=A0A5N6R6Q1_9ROSI|nr:hypothetical protein FH972_012881 [Carpinus fangiana]